MRYTVVLEREEDGGYVVSVPALPGCVSQGDTRAEALSQYPGGDGALHRGLPRCRRPGPDRSRKGIRRGRGRVGSASDLRRRVPKLPTGLSGRQVRVALESAGFEFRRQAGSHMILRRDDPYARVVIPDHRQIRPGTLRRIIADAGLTVDQFIQLLAS